MSPLAFIIIALIAALICVGILGYLRFTRQTVPAQDVLENESRVAALLAAYQERCTEFQRRQSILSNRATDYVNSLGAETARSLLQVTQILNEQSAVIAEARALLATRTRANSNLAEQLLNAQLASDSAPSDPGQLLWKFEPLAEELIQRVGREIYRASENAASIGLPKRRDRKPTAMHLVEAGIAGIPHKKPDESN